MTQLYRCACGAVTDGPSMQVTKTSHDWQSTTLVQLLTEMYNQISELQQQVCLLQEKSTSCDCSRDK